MAALSDKQIREDTSAVAELAKSLLANGVVADIRTANAAAARLFADGWTKRGGA